MVSMVEDARRSQAVPDDARGVVVAIDVSKNKIDFAAFWRGQRSRIRTVGQDCSGYRELALLLGELRASGYDPWVAFEPTGAYSACLRDRLLSSGERVVQVNGYHVKRTKEVRDNSPAKSDSKDPRVIADLVWQGCYQEVTDLPSGYAELRCATAEWASLSKKITALRNEFQSLLQVWFPELARIFKDPLCSSSRAVVRHYGSVSAIGSAQLNALRCVLARASKGRSVGRADAIRLAARDSIAAGTRQECRHQAMLDILDIIEVVESKREQLRDRMLTRLAEIPEAKHLLSIYGVGVITAAGLLGECGPLGRYRSFSHLEKFIGLNLFEVSSGQYRGQKHISKRGRALARYLICQAAIQQVRSRGLFYSYAQTLRARGKKPGQVRVAVARKLLRVLYAIGRDLVCFEQSRFFTGAQMEDGLLAQQGAQARAA